jgi:phage baseplate assembly protein gpV
VGTAALRACSIVDLHGEHIGRRVVLTFESGDPSKPIVIGVLRDHDDAPLPEQFGQVEVDADAGRLIITAKERLVLRCGTASITLTSSGKVLIEGSYVLSRSSGSNRVKGGSVQLN